ncbi:hypothetical protein B0H14DRAFT_2897897 [Mycena olivaceomarginata]|nr:hypothetical protein B0H14DRAFT_2897897 [Mycena olivaceomarginata]
MSPEIAIFISLYSFVYILNTIPTETFLSRSRYPCPSEVCLFLASHLFLLLIYTLVFLLTGMQCKPFTLSMPI